MSSILVVSNDDRHRSFVYFIPAGTIKHEWINKIIEENFDLVASRLGPDAVLIGPSVGRYAEYMDSFTETLHYILTLGVAEDDDEELHSGKPYLVATRRPFGLDVPSTETDSEFRSRYSRTQLAALNLGELQDPGAVREVLDRIIEVIRGGRDLVEELPSLSPAASIQKKWWRFASEEALELKPNVFGLGVNLNAIARWLNKNRSAPKA